MPKKSGGAQPMQSMNGGAMRPYQRGAAMLRGMIPGMPQGMPQNQGLAGNPMISKAMQDPGMAQHNPQLFQLLQSMGVSQQPMQGQPMQGPYGGGLTNVIRGGRGGRGMYNQQQQSNPLQRMGWQQQSMGMGQQQQPMQGQQGSPMGGLMSVLRR